MGERAVSRSTVLCQAPSAAPFAFNGLSKDPLSRAAESFLHFKKKKGKKGGNLSWVRMCEEMLGQELDSREFALCSLEGHG